MNALTLIQSLSLVEFLIVGFIAANLLLSGAYLVQCGFARRAEGEGE